MKRAQDASCTCLARIPCAKPLGKLSNMLHPTLFEGAVMLHDA